ncbi:MAG: hypothetical protein RR942_06905 [Romboutsia sp.]
MKNKKIKIIGLIFVLLIGVLSLIDGNNLKNKKEISINDKIKDSFIEELRKTKKYKWSKEDSTQWVEGYNILNISQVDYKTYNVDAEFILTNRIGNNFKIKDRFIIYIK